MGPGSKKHVKLILKNLLLVSTLFTECRNSTRFLRYDPFNFWNLDFHIGNRGIIFGDFFTIFAYEILNIDVESTKIVIKMQTMIESQEKS